MRFFVRYTKGKGNSTVYARLRDATGQFWDFVGLSWVTPQTNNCRVFLTEYADSDTLESLYQASASIPEGGPWIQEAVDVDTGLVIAADDNVMGQLTAIPAGDASIWEKIEALFQYFIFKRQATGTGDAGTETMYKQDGATTLGTATLSDTGTQFTKDRFTT